MPPSCKDPLTPEELERLEEAAERRADGLSWRAVAHELGIESAELRKLRRRRHLHHTTLQNIDYYALVDARQDAVITLRNQLHSPDPKIAQRAADIICRLETAHTLASFKAETTLLAAQAKTKTSKPKVSEIKWGDPNGDHNDWFPKYGKGLTAKSVYEYLMYATPEKLAKDRADDYREQCRRRGVRLADDPDPLPYWLEPGYKGKDAKGWLPGDPDYEDYHTHAKRPPWAPINMTDFYRAMAHVIKIPGEAPPPGDLGLGTEGSAEKAADRERAAGGEQQAEGSEEKAEDKKPGAPSRVVAWWPLAPVSCFLPTADCPLPTADCPLPATWSSPRVFWQLWMGMQ